MDELEKHLVIIRKIMELNEQKKRISYELNQKVAEMAGVSAKIGELSAELKAHPPCEN